MVEYKNETGSIELVVLGLLAALVVVLAFPIFDPSDELGPEAEVVAATPDSKG